MLKNYAQVLLHNFQSEVGKIRLISFANMSFATNLPNPAAKISLHMVDNLLGHPQ